MISLLFFLLKSAMIIGSLAMSITVFIKSFRYLVACRSINSNVNNATLAECKNTFTFAIFFGSLIRFLYWLLIPDLSNALSIAIVVDLLAMVGVIVLSFVFIIVPFHLIAKTKYRRVSVIQSAVFVKYAVIGILAQFVVVFLTGFPGSYLG